MYIASILSLLTFVSAALAAPAGPPAGFGQPAVQTAVTTVWDTVDVTVTVDGPPPATTATTAPSKVETSAVTSAITSAVTSAATSAASASSSAINDVVDANARLAVNNGHTSSKATSVAQTSQTKTSQASSAAQTSTKIPQTTLKTSTGAAPTVTGAPGLLTVQITNSMGNAITTSYQGETPPVSGASGVGVMTKGATAAFAVASGWHGGVAVSNGPNSGNDGLIEGSFVDQGWPGNPAVVDIDVSYVNGYTVPMTCSCVATNEVLSGCSLDLGLSKCTNAGATQYACPNPLRENLGYNLTPNAFFADCVGAAYTYPNDNGANAGNGRCQSGVVSCCVGTSCAKNPAQS